MEYVRKIISNIAKLKNKLVLVKLPSYIINNPKLLREFIDDISILTKCGMQLFIVHEYEDLLKKKLEDLHLNQEIARLQGISGGFLNTQIIELHEIIISGHISKFLVRSFNNYLVTSVGISGKDGNLVVTDRPLLGKSHSDKSNRFVCNVISVNPEIIFAFEPIGMVTIISPVAVDTKGHTSIVDVDDMIAKIATSAGFDYLIYVENGIRKESISLKVNSFEDLNEARNKLSLSRNLIKAAESTLQKIPANIYFIDADIPNPIVSTLINN